MPRYQNQIFAAGNFAVPPKRRRRWQMMGKRSHARPETALHDGRTRANMTITRDGRQMTTDILRRNNVTVSGAGDRPMLFAHGFGCDQSMWQFVAPEFARDHKVVLYDLTGAGNSDLEAYDRQRYATLDGHADDILAICEALNLKDTILVGHSVSASSSVLAANARPDLFSRLILVSPSPCFLNTGDYRGGFSREELDGLLQVMDENYLGWARQMAPNIAGQAGGGPAADRLTQSFCRTDPDIASHFARVTFLSDHRDDLARLLVPALALHCDDDPIAPMTVAGWLKDNMPAATVSVMQVTGHCPHLVAPEETVREIRRYLDGG